MCVTHLYNTNIMPGLVCTLVPSVIQAWCCAVHVIMPRLSNVDRACVIGQLEAGVRQSLVAARFGVSQKTISKLKQRYRDTIEVKDRPRSGRPRITTAATDHRIEALAARRRYVTATEIQVEVQPRVQQPGQQRISRQTVHRRLHASGLRSRRPAIVPAMTAQHERIRLAWCRYRHRWNRAQWGNVMFSDESRFCLHKNDGAGEANGMRGPVWCP